MGAALDKDVLGCRVDGVIASGGLASMNDIHRMSQPDAHVLEGAISGRALYDGRVDPAEALAVLATARGQKA